MTANKFQIVDVDGIEPDHDAPTPETLLFGDPKFTNWSIEQSDGLYSGVWQATPGKWRIAYQEWEFVHQLSGVSIITEDSGAAFTIKGGESFVIRPGFKGTWEVVETIRKHYVIKV